MWIWLVVAVLAAIGELLSYDLFLAPVSVAAIATAITALFLPVVLQTGIFAGLALLGIVYLRPVLRHALGLDSPRWDLATSLPSRIVGRRAIVTETVNALGGQIRIGEGEFWTARVFDPSKTLDSGQIVEVLLVEGIAALVDPVLEETPVTAVGSSRLIEKGIRT